VAELTDVEFRKQRARLSKLVTVWKDRLGLEQWHIVHTFHRGPIPGDKDADSGWSAAIGRGFPDHRYLHARIEWSLQSVAEEDDEDLQRHVIHELVHCLTDAFKQYAMRELGDNYMGAAEMERQVTEIEHAISFAYEAGIREGQRRAKKGSAIVKAA
jgi:hypothetical protein